MPLGYRPEPSAAEPIGDGDDDSPHRQLNNAALANLDAWVPALSSTAAGRRRSGYEAVPIWRPSTTGREPGKRHRNLKIVPEGIRDFGADQGYTPLDLVMAACGCDLDTAFRFLSERLGWAADWICPAAPADEARPSRSNKRAGEAERTDRRARALHNRAGVGRRDRRLDRRDQPASEPGAGARCRRHHGRHADRPPRRRAHTQRHPSLRRRNRAHRKRQAAGCSTAYPAAWRRPRPAITSGHPKFFSLSAVLELLSSKAAGAVRTGRDRCVAQGRHQPQSDQPRGGGQPDPADAMGCSFRQHADARWASARCGSSRCPALSIFGVSTPEEFHAALQGESVANGFLNRFLALISNIRAPDRDPETDPTWCQPALAGTLRALYLWSGPTSLIQIGNPSARPA